MNQLRKKIDLLDHKLLKLLNQRMLLSEKVGAWKLTHGEAVFVPEREEQLLRRLEAQNQGPLDNKALRSIYQEIIKSSIAVQRKLRIGFLGKESSQVASLAYARFGSQHTYRSLKTVPQLIRAFHQNEIEIAVAPRRPVAHYLFSSRRQSLPQLHFFTSGEIMRHSFLSSVPAFPSPPFYFILTQKASPPSPLSKTVVLCQSHCDKNFQQKMKSQAKKNKWEVLHHECFFHDTASASHYWQWDFVGDIKENLLQDFFTSLTKSVRHWCRLGSYSDTPHYV